MIFRWRRASSSAAATDLVDEPLTIRLRRPAIVSLSDQVWSPDAHLRDECERRWKRLRAANDRLFDGQMIQVAGVHRNGSGGAVIQGFPCDFRWYAIQAPMEDEDEIFDCHCRPLGVKGFTVCGQRYLVGRRASWTTFNPGCWEFAPSGGVEPGRTPEDAITCEFQEEIGRSFRQSPRAEAVLFDPAACTWEVAMRIEVASESLGTPTDEYDDLQWLRSEELPGDLTPIARRIYALLA